MTPPTMTDDEQDGCSDRLENGGVDENGGVTSVRQRAVPRILGMCMIKMILPPCDEVENDASLVKSGEAEWLTVLTNDGPDEWICNVKGKDRTPGSSATIYFKVY